MIPWAPQHWASAREAQEAAMLEMNWSADTASSEYLRLSEEIGGVEDEVMFAYWFDLVEAYKEGQTFEMYMVDI